MPFKLREDRVAYHRELYHLRREKAIKFLGGQCVHCGSKDNLQFDHIDPSVKEFDVSGHLTHSWEKLKRELLKCQILCEGCHLIKTNENHENPGGSHRKGMWSHGTYTGYRYGCRCEMCKEIYSLIRKEKYSRLKT